MTSPARTARGLGAAAAALALVMPAFAQAPVFRASSISVAVNVSVKRGNRVIANLTAGDFRLLDNGVQQVVDAVSIEAVPLDVTLFLDTSGSTAGRLDEMKREVQGIIAMLRAGDRFRLLTIGDSVDLSVPWVPAGTTVALPFSPVGGISLINDALAMALLHRPDADRRHLIVGMTDREDCGSLISAAHLRGSRRGPKPSCISSINPVAAAPDRPIASAPARRARASTARRSFRKPPSAPAASCTPDRCSSDRDRS
jgi:hypothetical protein